MNTNKYKVKTQDLRKVCNPSIFRFNSTADLKPQKGIIGQERAFRSLSFGLDMHNPGYNVFLSGIAGTGKTTLARETVLKKAKVEAPPSDWCYVHNFKNPDTPKVLQLKAGVGTSFKKDLTQAVDEALEQIIRTIESEEFEYNKSQILGSFVEKTNQMYLSLEEEARSFGFTISRNEGGITSLPLRNGEVLSQDDYMAMTEEERSSLMKNSSAVQEKLNEAFRQYRELEKNIKEQIKALETKTAGEVIGQFFTPLLGKYADYPTVPNYLKDMQEDLVDNIDVFIRPEEPGTLSWLRTSEKKGIKRRYQVNLIVNNALQKHAPVVIETNPTFSNLFGQIEYEGEFGILNTDFSKIKAGAIHKANGGYLVLNAADVVGNYYVWETLKRVLKNREINIESISRVIGISNTETLQPEPIPCDVKVILIGEPIYYYLLYAYDEEFSKLFKIRADFDTDMPRNRKTIYDYARFISSVCHAENLKHFTPEAVAVMVDYGSRLADNKNKLTSKFNRIMEIVYEAIQWASYDNSDLVQPGHVKRAIAEKRYRSSSYEDHIQEYIMTETILINTEGKRIGEINGLAVYQTGDYSFGKPVKITAKTFRGEKGLINIERETSMSGNIHSKGVLTLNGYLGAKYAQDKPLALSASLTFEQSYSGIEGDSASSAELYALLSSLAEVPISQGIAVTGSVNQNGEIQPVGGVNEKIEGFFKVCSARGLNGTQGVIIPKQNVIDLMLDDEIVTAVKLHKFHIWAVGHIDQGLEIITDLPAGSRDARGEYSPGDIHYKVNSKIKEWTGNNKTRKQTSVMGGKPRTRRSRW